MKTRTEDRLVPGDSVRVENRDDLLAKLDRWAVNYPDPGRARGRPQRFRERYCMLLYMRALASENLLSLPVTLHWTPDGQDPPDFVLDWAKDRQEQFEVTEGTTREYQKSLTEADRRGEKGLVLLTDINTPGREVQELWSEIMFAAFERKSNALLVGRYSLDHLLIYDLTGLGLFEPLERGGILLREKIERWNEANQPEHRFGRLSVLRDSRLFLDVCGEGRVVKLGSPYFQVAVLRADGTEDLSRRLRDLDRYCRQNSIRHLKLFGSVLGDRDLADSDEDSSRLFREDSDLDLLVEFETGVQVTLLDMARMRRELSELIGFQVDLRTAEDLSEYFRQQVLDQAVAIHA